VAISDKLIRQALKGDTAAYGQVTKWSHGYVKNHHGWHLTQDEVGDVVSAALADLLSLPAKENLVALLMRGLDRYEQRAKRDIKRFEHDHPMVAPVTAHRDDRSVFDRENSIVFNDAEQRMQEEFHQQIMDAILHYMVLALSKIKNDRYHDFFVLHYGLSNCPLRHATTKIPDFTNPTTYKALRRARKQFLANLERELTIALHRHEGDPEVLAAALRRIPSISPPPSSIPSTTKPPKRPRRTA